MTHFEKAIFFAKNLTTNEKLVMLYLSVVTNEFKTKYVALDEVANDLGYSYRHLCRIMQRLCDKGIIEADISKYGKVKKITLADKNRVLKSLGKGS